MWQSLQNYLQDNWLLAVSTPFYAVLISLEVLLSQWQHNKFYSFRETLINFWLNGVNTLIGITVKVWVLGILGFFLQWSVWDPPVNWLYWLFLFLGLDFCFYLEHRSEHYCRLLWAVHVTHHSSPEFNLTTGFRSSVFRPLVSFWFFIPLVILGFKPLDILFMDAICQIYGIIVHTRYVSKMPAWFEAIFVSPSHHRVHHASNVAYLDKNMGMVLIIWDRIFGTFQQERPEIPIRYGLTTPPTQPYHPLGIIFHEWFKLGKDVGTSHISFFDRLRYVFYPPGWSHDGSTLTAKQLRDLEKSGKSEQ